MKSYILLTISLLLSISLPAQDTAKKTVVAKDSLKLKNITLKEVAIKSKRPLIQMEIDKTVVNVGSMISSASSNTLEVLEKTPGVVVNQNGEISLNGRGSVMVMIDGRQTYMSGPDLANYLKSIPGGSLDKIELMDNPPAKYDAAGNGIINIRLKKNRTGGFTGNLSSGYSQGEFARTNNALNLNYNHKKLNVFSNTSYSFDKNYNSNTYNRRLFDPSGILDSRLILGNEQEDRSNGVNANLGIDYAATANTTYGIQLNVNKNTKNGHFSSQSSSFSPDKLDSLGMGYITGSDRKTNLMSNLNFLHKFGKTGIEWSADANYLQYTGNGNQNLQNQVFNPDGNQLDEDNFLYQLPNTMDIYTIKTDYVHPLKNKARIEAGFKWSKVKNNNQSDYYLLQNNLQLADNGRSNHFIYQENFTAAYITAQKSWKQFGIQTGLRVEHTGSAGNQLGNAAVAGSSFTKNYTQMFPSLFLSYKLDTVNRNTLVFSLTRRINRPNYQQLNPFTFFRDQYSYNSGNPDLEPQYQYRYELKYQYRQILRMGLSYNHFTNVVFQTTNVVNGIFITRPENVREGYMLLLNSGANLPLAKWWTFNTDVLLSRMGLNGEAYGEKLNPKTFVARINILNQLQFDKGWSAEFGGYYASRDLNGQTFTAGMFRANAGLQKKILKEKGSIRLNMDDIFHSWKYLNRSVALKQAYYFQNSQSDTRRVGLAFTYSFGSDTFARKSKHRDNSLDEEKGRMQ
ncbi:MAG: TonB-dependent receptor [Bacteroidota bacterium]